MEEKKKARPTSRKTKSKIVGVELVVSDPANACCSADPANACCSADPANAGCSADPANAGCSADPPIISEPKCDSPVVPKKRGRKPKGGKIIDIGIAETKKDVFKPNIILHLKCSSTDLDCDGNRESDFSQVNINSYSSDIPNYHLINTMTHDIPAESDVLFGSVQPPAVIPDLGSLIMSDDNPITMTSNGSRKEIWKKLKSLEHLLHMNSVPDSNAACFWCTYEFDNPPAYIPKMFLKNSYHVYGCFCSPECAVAYLMNENLDSSSKFERYSLLNTIYNSVYGYSKNIKPAPDPHYLLNKFFGNLSIQEYRALLRSDRLFLVVDKPITRILPELHEDNDEFIINNKIIPTASNYQVKRKLKSTVNKTHSTENFGIFAPSVP